jgi:hypothetical protein
MKRNGAIKDDRERVEILEDFQLHQQFFQANFAFSSSRSKFFFQLSRISPFQVGTLHYLMYLFTSRDV